MTEAISFAVRGADGLALGGAARFIPLLERTGAESSVQVPPPPPLPSPDSPPLLPRLYTAGLIHPLARGLAVVFTTVTANSFLLHQCTGSGCSRTIVHTVMSAAV